MAAKMNAGFIKIFTLNEIIDGMVKYISVIIRFDGNYYMFSWYCIIEQFVVTCRIFMMKTDKPYGVRDI